MRRISVRILCTLMALMLCACAAPAAQPVPSPLVP